MRATTKFGVMAAAFAILLGAGVATAQQVSEPVDKKRDWTVFATEGDQKVCWILTQPSTSVASRSGKRVKVKRGPIYLTVAVRPANGVKNEISVAAGYPLKPDSLVEVKIGPAQFEMFTKGEGAWLVSADEDDKMVAEMKKGSTAVVSGVSTRGTATTDTFSLLGFTAALEAAQSLCGL